VVWDAEDLRIMEMFLDGSIDVHWERTKDIFGLNRSIPYEKHEIIEVPLVGMKLKMYDLRRLGKTSKHAGNYGMGPYKFLQILAREDFILPYSVGKKILHRTVEEDPYLQSWHRDIENRLKAYRMLETPLGRRRYFLHSRLNDNLFRAGYAFCPQSTIGEIIEEGIQKIFEKCGDYLRILLNVHDEIIYEVAPHNLARSLVETQEFLEIPFELKGRELRIPCEAKAGMNWGELHEFEPQLEEEV
jgi:DNA polymerase I-like protein with 3'-5' exonuclease and polymerase domains